MSPSDFRITTTAVTIDTTDTSSWIVYDHYRDQSTYDAMKLDASLQPYRAADNTKTDGNGKISDYFANGGTTVNWKLTDPANYEIASVTNNGAPVDYAPTGEQDTYAFTISDITADQNVVITLRQKNSDKHEKVLEPTITRTTYNVTTAIKGKGGSISNGGSVVPGSSETVKWTLEEGAEVRYVFVNGQLRPDLVQAGQVTLSEISQDQSVVVYLAAPGASSPVNVDKDGDGTPDINIDKDNDGLPDVDVDTDDDGEPDVNIDTDGDGEPDVNIDTDGDLVPDANIDTNGDLIPDVNIINRGSHVISDPNIVTIGAVQTGDVDLSLMILVMLASAMGLAAVLRKRLGMSK